MSQATDPVPQSPASHPSQPESEQQLQANSTPSDSPNELDDYEPLTPELVEEEAMRGDFVLKWAVVLLAFLLGSTRIAETTTLVHVKTGQYLASHGLIPSGKDVFSYTAIDRPWTNLSWGFDLLIAGAFAVGSWAGVSFLKAILAALIFGLVVSIRRPNLPTWWGSICAAGALLACLMRLTAQPALITLLGAALIFWLVHAWQRSGNTKFLWLLIPTFFVWGNADSRAFLGLFLLLLYAVGSTLDARLKRGDRIAGPRKPLWIAVAGSVLAMVLHPFGWKSLLSPLSIYGTEYTAFREYIRGAYVGGSFIPSGGSLLYFPLTTPAFWSHFGEDVSAVSALAVIAATVVVLVLNFKRVEMAHLLIFSGSLLLAFLCIHELAFAAVVCAILAALNGQAWYAATFRQTYGIETAELFFSRGGRAATVLAFAAVAFFGGTGRLRDSQAPRTGFGLDRNLATAINDLTTQLHGNSATEHGSSDDPSYDHRPFNFLLTQGDQLIWIGEQVFADSRVAVYYSSQEEENLLARHVKVREALRYRRDPASKRITGSPKRNVWKKAFDEFDVTHVVVRLSGTENDYVALYDLLEDDAHWELTSLGASAAVHYRLDRDDVDLQRYVEKQRLDFSKEAFRKDGRLIAARHRWIRSPTFYQKYFWAKKREVPPEIQKALHLARLANGPILPQRFQVSRSAMAFLAIHSAQEGLAVEPDVADGYVALGMAYDFLSLWDATLAINPARTPFAGLRYLQSVASYQQALVGEPNNAGIHLALIQVFTGSRRIDLQLRHMESLDRIWSADETSDPEQLLQLSTAIGQLRKHVTAVEEELVQFADRGAKPYDLANAALQRGCLLSALKQLDVEAEKMTGNLLAEQLRISLLLEAGRVEEASDAAARFEDPARSAGLFNWQDTVAMACLPDADYPKVIDLWELAAADADNNSFSALLTGLRPQNNGRPDSWPVSALTAAETYGFRRPQMLSRFHFNIALTQLEQGQIGRATKELRDALEADPENSDRILMAYYLRELTGKDEVDLFPPSERVPGEFAPEPAADAE